MEDGGWRLADRARMRGWLWDYSSIRVSVGSRSKTQSGRRDKLSANDEEGGFRLVRSG